LKYIEINYFVDFISTKFEKLQIDEKFFVLEKRNAKSEYPLNVLEKIFLILKKK